jgi:hypothetical protein
MWPIQCRLPHRTRSLVELVPKMPHPAATHYHASACPSQNTCPSPERGVQHPATPPSLLTLTLLVLPVWRRQPPDAAGQGRGTQDPELLRPAPGPTQPSRMRSAAHPPLHWRTMPQSAAMHQLRVREKRSHRQCRCVIASWCAEVAKTDLTHASGSAWATVMRHR